MYRALGFMLSQPHTHSCASAHLSILTALWFCGFLNVTIPTMQNSCEVSMYDTNMSASHFALLLRAFCFLPSSPPSLFSHHFFIRPFLSDSSPPLPFLSSPFFPLCSSRYSSIPFFFHSLLVFLPSVSLLPSPHSLLPYLIYLFVPYLSFSLPSRAAQLLIIQKRVVRLTTN